MSSPVDSPVGMIGRVVTPTRGDAGPGEVELRIRGGTETFIAYSAGPLPRGEAVVVAQTLGPRSVVVLPMAAPDDRSLEL